MTPGLGTYLAGVLSLAVIVGALGFGAHHLRRWLVPELSGATARLAELVLGISLLVLVLQLLGTIGLLRAGWIPAACAVAGMGVGLLGRARAEDGGRRLPAPAPPASRIAVLIAAGVAAWTVADWSFPAQLALDRGMFGGDTTWYHMPIAARFAQEGSIVGLHFTDPLRLAVWFYPHTSELVNAAGISILRTDFLAPLMNLGWLCLGLLAAWCVGRPFGVAPATLVAACLVFDSGVMWETQTGEARNDTMALALLLAFVALLVNGRRMAPAAGPAHDPGRGAPIAAGALLVAGLAAGLAVSTKLTMLQPVAAIALGFVLFGEPRRRGRAALILGGALLATGVYWYARNLVHAGNPLPLFAGIGPFELPHPAQLELFPRAPHSVSEYLLDPGVLGQWFVPKLDDALGPLWPALLLGALGSAAYLVLRDRDPILRVLAGAALLNFALYLFTPISASGAEGEPTGFFTNTRYVMPALLLGLVLLPLAFPLRRTVRARRRALALVAASFAVTTLATPAWTPEYLRGALLIAAVSVWLPLAAIRRRPGPPPGRGLAIVAVAIAVLAVALGREQQAQYAERRYADPTPFLNGYGPLEAFDWARDVRSRRIGVAGAGQAFFTQYGWYGADLSNSVQYVGVEGPNGAFTLPGTCRELRRTVNAGDYDYLVAAQNYLIPTFSDDLPVREWLAGDRALSEIVADEDGTFAPSWVYRVDGELDPAGCGGDRARPARRLVEEERDRSEAEARVASAALPDRRG